MARRGAFSEETRNLVLRRCFAKCELCGAAPVQEIHHRIPRGMGGVAGEHAAVVESPANALGLCRGCHHWAERGDRAQAREWGIVLRRSADPAAEPFYSPRRRGWFVLDAWGGKGPDFSKLK